MTIKTAGIFLIAAGIFLAGREWERQKQSCVHELEYFYRLLQFLEQEIVYRQTKLPAALIRFSEYAKGKTAVFASLLVEKLKKRQEAAPILWSECISEIYGRGFCKEELRVMEQAGYAFSFWQKQMISEQTELDRQRLWELWQQKQGQFQKDCHLFRCLFAAASLFVVIVLI